MKLLRASVLVLALYGSCCRLSSVTMGLSHHYAALTPPSVVIQNSAGPDEDVMRRSSRGRVEALTDDPAKVRAVCSWV